MVRHYAGWLEDDKLSCTRIYSPNSIPSNEAEEWQWKGAYRDSNKNSGHADALFHIAPGTYDGRSILVMCPFNLYYGPFM